VGCGCGGSTWTPTPPPGVQQDAQDSSGPRGLDNPATFWTGPAEAPAPEPEPAASEA